MVFGALVRLTAALFLAHAAVNGSAWAATGPATTPSTSLNANGLQTLESYLAPTRQVVQELQSGFNRLSRMCSYGTFTSQPDSSKLDLVSTQLSFAREQLNDVQSQIRSDLSEFRQKSSLATASYCRFVPEFSLIGLSCHAYRQDAAKAASVARIADQLMADAALRIDFYEKYVQLEARGCTRTGFAQKLWQNERSWLWPLVEQSPMFFKRQLDLPK
jgi:hypothetical protein